MLIFLHGEDTFRSSLKIQEIKEKYSKTQGHNLRVFDCSILESSVLKEELGAVSLFRDKKLLILRDLFSNKGLQDFLLEQKDALLKTDDVFVFWEQGPFKKSSRLFKFLSEHAKVQEFSLLSDASLHQWAQREFQKYSANIETKALDLLLQSTGNDLWRLSNEIQKLAAFSSSLSLTDVQSMVVRESETDIFATIDAVAAGQKARALNFLSQHLEKGESPLYLLSMIAYQFRNLLEVKDAKERKTPLKALSLHPYVLMKAEATASKLSFEKLKQIYTKIVDADKAIKTGESSPEITLSLLVAQL